MSGLQFYRKIGVILLTVLVVAGTLSGCARTETVVPTASPEIQKPARDKRSATGTVTISQVISDNGQPVGLQLGERQILRFTTPESKLYTDGLAFQSAVGEGLGGFLITPNAPTWSNVCDVAGMRPEDLSMEQSELFTPHWQACRLGEQWVILSSVEVSAERATQPMWLAVPTHEEWQSELQRVEWSLELTIR